MQRFMFCRLMYNLYSALCSAARVQVVRHFLFCRLVCKLCGTSICFDHYYCLMDVARVCRCILNRFVAAPQQSSKPRIRLHIRPLHSRFCLQPWDLLASAILTPGNSECTTENDLIEDILLGFNSRSESNNSLRHKHNNSL